MPANYLIILDVASQHNVHIDRPPTAIGGKIPQRSGWIHVATTAWKVWEVLNFLIPLNESVQNSTAYSVDRNFARYELVIPHLPPCQFEHNTTEKIWANEKKTEWPQKMW